MNVVYARADKVHPDCDYITEGKIYPVNESGDAFQVKCDDGIVVVAYWHGSHGVTWTRIEYPYRDPADVEVALAALREVISVTGDYLPPDGISKDECISRILGATDNVEIYKSLKALGCIPTLPAALKGEPQ